MKHIDQTRLLELLKKGDEKAYVYLVDEYNQRLFAYVLTLTNDSGMAQDIIQSVFLRTWENRKKIVIKTSIQNYLFKSVHNECMNQHKKKRAISILERKYFEALDKTTERLDENLVQKVIDKITVEIQNLPPRCREIFILSRKEGLTNIEIASYLNISTKTVEGQITKAFSLLRKKLKGRFETILFFLWKFNLKQGLNPN